MDYINIHIPPANLDDKSLLLEYGTITKIPAMVSLKKADLNDIPDKFTLGDEHINYFFDKLMSLLVRYNALHAECVRRDFKVDYSVAAWKGIPANLLKRTGFSIESRDLARQRILDSYPYPYNELTYMSRSLDLEEYTQILLGLK